MGTGVGAATQEGGKLLGEPSSKKKSKKIESEGSGMVDVPTVPKTPKATKKSASEHSTEKSSAEKAQPSSGKKVSAYNSFVGKHRRSGKTMKEIGEMWRSHKE
jgi:hypothetical protein